MLHMHMNQKEREHLKRVSRPAVGRVARRAQMVLRCDRGSSVPQSAEMHAGGEDGVRPWLHRYEHRGVEGVEEDPRSGRPSKDAPLWTPRGHTSQPGAPWVGARSDPLDGRLAPGLSGRAGPSGALLFQHPTVSPPDGLALGASAAGSSAQPRPGGPGRAGSPGACQRGGQAGSRPLALSG